MRQVRRVRRRDYSLLPSHLSLLGFFFIHFPVQARFARLPSPAAAAAAASPRIGNKTRGQKLSEMRSGRKNKKP